MRWIIGDIHGMLRPLETIVREISRLDDHAVFYFVGDYLNRGRDSRGVVRFLRSMSNARCIRGNHDDILDQILHGIGYAENDSRGDRYMAFQWFLEHGLLETLLSYGATREQIGRVITQRNRNAIEPIINLFPPEDLQFIRNLPIFIEDDDLFVVHGKWPLRETRTPAQLLGEPAIPDPALRRDVLWGRYSAAEIRKRKAWPKPGFFGHTPVQTYQGHETEAEPIIGANMILLDTGVAVSPQGRLTAMCAETSEILQADPAGRLVSTSKNASVG